MTAQLDSLPVDWSRPVTRRDVQADSVLAGALLVTACITTPLYARAEYTVPPGWFTAGWIVLLTAPLALRRRHPSAVAVVVVGTLLVGQFVVAENLVSQVAPFIALYSVGAWEGNRRRSIVVRAALIAVLLGVLAVGIAYPALLQTQPVVLPIPTLIVLSVVSNLVYVVAVLVLGEGARLSARRLATLQLRTAQLQAERERSAAQAVALERLHIARELHDVVAHHVSVIGIQAGAARRVLPGNPEKAVTMLGTIEQNMRTVVDELRRTLMTLRSGDDGAPEPAPDHAASTLGVDQIPALVAESGRSGPHTVLTVVGPARPLPPLTDVVVYRVVQEALTNVRKHAGLDARAEVRLRYRQGTLDVEIENEGATPSQVDGGLGQLGMRERVAAVRGTLATGPTPSGYVVRATVPVPEPEDA